MKQLVQSERDEIEILLRKWYSLRAISRVLQKAFETIRREVMRNKVHWRYTARKAQHKAYVRRKNCKKTLKKIRVHDELENYIRDRLRQDWSPDEIAHTWSDTHSLHISTPTIYHYIYSRFWYWLTDHLYTKRLKKKRRTHHVKKEIIIHRVFIDARTKIISRKRQFWHWECDLIVGKQSTKPVLLVLIEMKTRYKVVYLLPSKSALWVETRLKECIKKYSIKSITFDNGTEFSYHYNLWIPTYFCHPHSPREKPQVERWNRNIRWYYPKGTDFSQVSQADIDTITQKLNIRPMKCLHYKSSFSLFHKYLLSPLTALTL